MSHVLRIAAVLCLIAATVPVAAGSELFERCAASAASVWEAGYEGVGPFGTSAYYAYEAIDACEAAHAM